MPPRAAELWFRCNVCGRPARAKVAELGREIPSCRCCGSTVRNRALVHWLSVELFGKSLAIHEFPHRPDIVGIDMSGWHGYGQALGERLGYRNTYYHMEPKLDITAIDPSLLGTLDFVISSDVFEHVAPPVSIAFENTRRLLKPGGVLIVTVPYTKEAGTKEHFPDLYQYEIVKEGDDFVLINTTRSGERQVFRNLVFHGGPGTTLEMRVFSEKSLVGGLERAGFEQVKIRAEPDYDAGVVWHESWSLPVTARVPRP